MKRYRRPEKNPKQTALMIVIGASLMLLIHHAPQYWTQIQERFFVPSTSQDAAQVVGITDVRLREAYIAETLSDAVMNVTCGVFYEEIYPEWDAPQAEPDAQFQTDSAEPVEFVDPVALDVKDENPAGKIVLIIDDMGMNRKNSFAVMALPEAMTLAFLPYAPHVQDMVNEAKQKGHEIFIHVPMQAVESHVALGPLALRMDMSPAQIQDMLDRIFTAFSGYTGINNHMGSAMTQDADAMTIVMQALKKKGLMFVDSKTIATSVAAEIADETGVPNLERNVFLDHEDSLQGVNRRLAEAEKTARRKGLAVVIGHPKDSTIAALRAWLPGLEEKNIKIISARAALGLKPE